VNKGNGKPQSSVIHKNVLPNIKAIMYRDRDGKIM
jgi:hypothetical protein